MPARKKKGGKKIGGNKAEASHNPWIMFLKQYAAQHGISYGEALHDPRASAAYHSGQMYQEGRGGYAARSYAYTTGNPSGFDPGRIPELIAMEARGGLVLPNLRGGYERQSPIYGYGKLPSYSQQPGAYGRPQWGGGTISPYESY